MNWEQFLTDHNIEYVISGPNTKRGEVSIKCPWCGSDDPSQHLGISLTRNVWGCYRNSLHRGKSAVRLIRGLLPVTLRQAAMLERQYSQSDPDDLDKALAALEAPLVEEEPVSLEPKTMPVEFLSQAPEEFCKYLFLRGISPESTKRFKLRFALEGRYRNRIIFPLYFGDSLIGWTGRTIITNVQPRYLASSGAAKTTLYGSEVVKNGGDLLFVVEGPFDALKINVVGQSYYDYHIGAVALMGTSMTPSQFMFLRALKKKWKIVKVFLDAGTIEQSIHISDMLGVSWMNIHYADDPALLSSVEIRNIVDSIMFPF